MMMNRRDIPIFRVLGIVLVLGMIAVPALAIPLVPIPPLTTKPVDLNGDGLVEDLNCNGQLDYNDVKVFIQNRQWIETNEPVPAFDFTGNGRIDSDDIIRLFLMVDTIIPAPPQNVTVRFIDVGQGDSIIIQAPNGHEMLIDAGPPGAGSTVSAYAKNLGITDFEVVAITHPHEDHAGGMPQLVQDIPVYQVLRNGDPYSPGVVQNLNTLIEQKGIPVRTVKSGDYIDLDPSVNITVLNPQADPFGDRNEDSIVFRVEKGNIVFLLEGDAGTKAENYMMSQGAPLDADILKIGHHGSSSATGTDFLTAVSPQVGVIEVGTGNSYGHPTAKTLQRLMQAGVQVYRTDYNGTVTITTDGSTYTVTSEK